jgi:DNA-binding response OmpR family regulator
MYDNRAKAIEAGFNDFLTKPVSPADLIDRVKRLRE